MSYLWVVCLSLLPLSSAFVAVPTTTAKAAATTPVYAGNNTNIQYSTSAPGDTGIMTCGMEAMEIMVYFSLRIEINILLEYVSELEN